MSTNMADIDFLDDNLDMLLSHGADEIEEDFSLTQIANEMEEDISLSQLANELEDNFYMMDDDRMLCQVGDRYDTTFDFNLLPRGHESTGYVANDVDLFDLMSFDLGLPAPMAASTLDEKPVADVKQEICDERFTAAVTEDEIQKLISSQTNANTQKNTKWAVGVFTDWRHARAKHTGDNIPEIQNMNAECMSYWLQRFVMEVQKKKGGDYPPKSLYYIVCGLLRHCRDLGVTDKNFLDEKDGRFQTFRRVLDSKMKELLSRGIGTKVRRADPVSKEDEEKLWGNGVFGSTDSVTLQYTVFFYTCKLFGLRGRDEHRNLMGSQFEIGHDSTGKYLRFVGRDSKTFKGGLGQLKLNTKDIKHYSDGGTRCIIDFFELYLKAVGDGTFYRKPLNPGTKEKFRYGKHPLGINKLNSMMKEICQKGGLLGNFTNHSGKRTCATALYRAGVDEQEIMERTGHRSTAVRQYKTTSGDIQKRVSSVLSPPVENKKPEYSFEPQTKIPNTLQTFNENATKRVLSDVLPVENKPENSFEPPTKIPNTVQKADENVTKRVLSDVTNMQGGYVAFSNCSFNFN